MIRHLVSIHDLSAAEVAGLYRLVADVKANPGNHAKALRRKSLGAGCWAPFSLSRTTTALRFGDVPRRTGAFTTARAAFSFENGTVPPGWGDSALRGGEVPCSNGDFPLPWGEAPRAHGESAAHRGKPALAHAKAHG